jgi:hypothetical protein
MTTTDRGPRVDTGTAVAVLRLEPEDLAGRGVAFLRGHDDLDYVKFAWIDDDMGFVRHEKAPERGTEVVVKNLSSRRPADVARQLEMLLHEFGLSRRDLTWIRSDLEPVGALLPKRRLEHAFKAFVGSWRSFSRRAHKDASSTPRVDRSGTGT